MAEPIRNYKSYKVMFDGSEKRFAEILRTIVKTRSKLTSSFYMYNTSYPKTLSRTAVDLILKIPEGREKLFYEINGVELKKLITVKKSNIRM